VINFVCVRDHLEASDRTVLSTFKHLLYIIYMDIGALLINFCIRSNLIVILFFDQIFYLILIDFVFVNVIHLLVVICLFIYVIQIQILGSRGKGVIQKIISPIKASLIRIFWFLWLVLI